MNKETKTVSGVVKSIRKDKKGVQLADGNWYASNYFNGEMIANKGDEVEVTYIENGQYKNLSSIKVIKKSTIFEPAPTYSKNEDMVASQLTSYAKDLMIKLLDVNKDIDIQTGMATIAKAVTTAFTSIKEELNGSTHNQRPESNQSDI